MVPLALTQVLLGIVVWVGKVHPLATSLPDYFINSVATKLYEGALVWVLYLALEPSIRARWPQAVITWNRLLAGRFSDPQVAADILIGATLGMLLWLVAALLSPRMLTPNMFAMGGARQWVEMLPGIVQGSLRFSLVILFTWLGERGALIPPMPEARCCS